MAVETAIPRGIWFAGADIDLRFTGIVDSAGLSYDLTSIPLSLTVRRAIDTGIELTLLTADFVRGDGYCTAQVDGADTADWQPGLYHFGLRNTTTGIVIAWGTVEITRAA